MRKVILILVPLLVLAIALAGTHILVERLFILIALAILLSYLLACLGFQGLRGYLKDPVQHLPAGQPLPMEAVIENLSPLPKMFLQLKVAAGRSVADETVRISLPGRRAYSWNHELSFPKRGIYTLGPLSVESGDPLGLFRLKRTLDKGKTVLIYPPAADLPFFQAETGPISNKLRTADATGVISGIRDYMPGDGLNRIHWRSSAHRDKLMVKEFEVDRTEKIWIILDLNREQFYGSGAETTEEYGISITSSLVKKYADSERAVGLIAQGQQYHFFPAQQGNLNMWRIMDDLAVMKADGTVPLPRILNRSSEYLTGNSVALIITAAAGDDILEAVINARKKGIRAILILLDAGSFGGELSSPQSQSRLRAPGIPVYVVKKGDHLAEALNSRRINSAAGPGEPGSG
jgi:uncharacterized protein (DUF58 family)